MSNILVLPIVLAKRFGDRCCCQCDEPATTTINLIDGETGNGAGKKHFCDAHAPSPNSHRGCEA